MRFKRSISPVAQYNPKLKGGALYIAIIVSIIIGVFMSFFILIGNYNQKNITAYTQSLQLYYNLQSAFDMAQSGYFGQEINNSWIKNTASDDSLKIVKRFWGAYLMLSVYTKNRHHQLSQSGLYGTFMNSDTALMISDNGRPVSISGEVTFKANCYLPRSGIKPANIEGQSYVSKPENNAFVKSAAPQIPDLQPAFIEGVKRQRDNFDVNTDSSVSQVPPVLNHPFTKRTVVWETPQRLLGHMKLSNNVRIVAGNVDLDSSCHLNNVLLVCSRARFKEGFKGAVHVIALDSIIAEKNCVFEFPSSFVLLPNEEDVNVLRYIVFNENCRFFGGVLAIKKSGIADDAKQKVLIKLHAKSEVNGLVYTNGYLHLEGTLNATVMGDRLLLKTPSAVYENHMLGCTLDPKKYAQSIAIPLALKDNGKLLCCEKIN